MNFRQLAKEENSIKHLTHMAHANSLRKGFYDNGNTPVNVPEKLALIHSEVSEALEADRAGDYRKLSAFEYRLREVMTSMDPNATQEDKDITYARLYKEYVKDSFGGELAGTIIRCMDLAGYLGIDLEGHVLAEMRYNATRPHKHGKKY